MLVKGTTGGGPMLCLGKGEESVIFINKVCSAALILQEHCWYFWKALFGRPCVRKEKATPFGVD